MASLRIEFLTSKHALVNENILLNTNIFIALWQAYCLGKSSLKIWKLIETVFRKLNSHCWFLIEIAHWKNHNILNFQRGSQWVLCTKVNVRRKSQKIDYGEQICSREIPGQLRHPFLWDDIINGKWHCQNQVLFNPILVTSWEIVANNNAP